MIKKVKLMISIIALIFVSFSILTTVQAIKPTLPKSLTFDSETKYVVLGENVDIRLSIDDTYTRSIDEFELLCHLSDFSSFNDYFEVIDHSSEWEVKEVDDVTYPIIEEWASDIYIGKSILFLKDNLEGDETIDLKIKPKEKGEYILTVKQVNIAPAQIKICVGDTTKEAKSLCRERNEYLILFIIIILVIIAIFIIRKSRNK